MRLTDLVPGTADRPALLAGGRELSYRELHERAAGVATTLTRHGIGPGELVGVRTADPHELLPAAVGALRAGCAYLPLDPAAPAERWRRAAQRIGIAALLDPACTPLARPRPIGTPAYAVLTSGSTGEPKAVAVGHEAAVASTLARRDVYPGRVERFLWHSPPAFDSSMAALFWTLADGGTLVVPDARTRLDPARLAAFAAEHEVTHTMCLPRVWRAVLGVAPPGLLDTLRVVVVAGEAVPAGLVDEHAARCSAGLWNEYGPAEGAVWVTGHRCLPGEAVVPIGSQRSGAEVLVLDDRLRPCPPGEPGEIWLAGPGLALGYPGDPAQTAARFVPSPVEPGGRAYRTGDLGAWTAEGLLEFRGRRDDQVKVSGVRVEPAEIERALGTVPGVREAAVLAHEGRGGTALTGYLTGANLDPAAVRERLAGLLPPQLVPARLVVLPELPRNANGKVDRRALAATPHPEPEAAADVPEELLRDVLAAWRTALRAPGLTPSADLFAEGGDSITAVLICARLGERGLAATPAEVFQARTPAALATLLEGRAATAPVPESAAEAERDEQEPADRMLPLTPVQRWFLATQPGRRHWNFSIGLDVRHGDPDVVRAALMDTVARQPMLAARFGPGGVRPGHGAVPTVLELGADQARVAERTAYWQGTLDPVEGPVARLVWFQGEGLARAVLVAHHLVVDAVSWRVLLTELTGALAGQRPAATAPSVLEPVAGDVPGWLALATAADTPLLGTAPGTEGGAVRLPYRAGERAASALVDAAARVAGGADTLLLAALAHGVATALPGLPRLGVEVEGHGRVASSAGAVGWFTSFHPVAVPLAGAGTFGGALTAAGAALAAVPSTDYLATAYSGLPGAAELAAVPAAPIGLNYFGRVDTELRAAGSTLAVDFGPPAQRDPAAPRRHLLDVDCLVVGDELVLAVTHPDDADCAGLAATLAAAAGQAVADSVEVRDARVP